MALKDGIEQIEIPLSPTLSARIVFVAREGWNHALDKIEEDHIKALIKSLNDFMPCYPKPKEQKRKSKTIYYEDLEDEETNK